MRRCRRRKWRHRREDRHRSARHARPARHPSRPEAEQRDVPGRPARPCCSTSACRATMPFPTCSPRSSACRWEPVRTSRPNRCAQPKRSAQRPLRARRCSLPSGDRGSARSAIRPRCADCAGGCIATRRRRFAAAGLSAVAPGSPPSLPRGGSGGPVRSAGQLAFQLQHPEQVELTARGGAELPGSLGHRLAAVVPDARMGAGPPQTGDSGREGPILLAARSRVRIRGARRGAPAGHRPRPDAEPRARLACVTVLKSSRIGMDLVDAEGRNLHVRRLVELKHWARPLEIPPERTTYHVLEAPDVGDGIVEFAASNHVDHIVIGSRGASTFRRYLGSVSSQVVARAPVAPSPSSSARFEPRRRSPRPPRNLESPRSAPTDAAHRSSHSLRPTRPAAAAAREARAPVSIEAKSAAPQAAGPGTAGGERRTRSAPRAGRAARPGSSGCRGRTPGAGSDRARGRARPGLGNCRLVPVGGREDRVDEASARDRDARRSPRPRARSAPSPSRAGCRSGAAPRRRTCREPGRSAAAPSRPDGRAEPACRCRSG